MQYDLIDVRLARCCGQDSILADRFLHGWSSMGAFHIEKIPIHGQASLMIHDMFNCRIYGISLASDQFCLT
jgi:hypothetical protein